MTILFPEDVDFNLHYFSKAWGLHLTFDSVATGKGTKVTMTLDYESPYSVLGKLVGRLMARQRFEIVMIGGTQRAKEIMEAV